jgi:hypothetical protein
MRFMLKPKTAGTYRLFSVIADDASTAADLAKGLLERGCDEIEIVGLPDDVVYSMVDIERMAAEEKLRPNGDTGTTR